jgi:PAS domain S-box-containing protein
MEFDQRTTQQSSGQTQGQSQSTPEGSLPMHAPPAAPEAAGSTGPAADHAHPSAPAPEASKPRTWSEPLAAIYRLSEAITHAADVGQICEEALDTLQHVLRADRASVLLLDQDGVMRFKAWRGLSDQYRRAVEGHSPWPPDARDPQPVLVPDVQAEPALQALAPTILAENIRALAFIPLIYQGRLMGKFMIYYDRPHSFSDEEVLLARTIASHIAFALARTVAEEERAALLAQIEGQRRWLDELISNVPGVVWEAWGKPDEADQRINYVSSYAEKMLGYSVQEWLSTPNFWLTIMHPEDRERAARAAVDKFNSGGGVSQFRWVARDGQVIWVEAHSITVYDEQGQPVGMRGVTMDITERKRVEQELAESEREMTSLAVALDRALAESELLNAIAQAASGEADLGRILLAALDHLRPLVAFTGGSIALVEGDELVVRAATGPFSDMVMDQHLPRGRGKSWQVIEQRVPFLSHDLQAEGLKSTSPIRSYLAVPLVWRDSAFGLLEIDSTEPNAFDEEHVKLMQRVAVALSGPVQLARQYAAEVRAVQLEQQHAARLHGLAEAALAINSLLPVRDILHNITEQARHIIGAHQAVTSLTVGGNWEQAINSVSLSDKYTDWRDYAVPPNGSGIYSLVCRTNTPMRLTQIELETHPAWRGFGTEADRHPPMRGWLAAPLVGRDGRNLGLIQLSDKYEGEFTEQDEAILVQLAQMASAAIENARLYQQAQEAISARDQLISMVSHDLKNPLGVIRAYAQMLQKRLTQQALPDIERLSAWLGQIESATDKMNAFINELLDLAQVQAGRPLDLERRPTDLVALTIQVVAQVRPTTNRHTIEVYTDVPELVGHWDPLRIERVLTNLLTNAVKYSPDGGAVEVRVGREQGAGDMGRERAVWSVRDYGIGIPATDLPHIFERFHRGSNVAGHIGGTGLGLASARHIVEQHGGTILVHSQEGKGSTFTVYLPL